MDGPEKLRHLRIDDRANAERFVSPMRGRDRFKMPPRDRMPHGTGLIDQLDDAEARAREDHDAAEATPTGIVLVFKSEPNFELALKSLEAVSQGIELLNVRGSGRFPRGRIHPQRETHLFQEQVPEVSQRGH